MKIKTLLLGAVMTGALMVPAIAMANDAAEHHAAETKTEAPKAETKAAEPAKTEAAAPAGDDRAAKAFASFDADGNGGISEDEFVNHKRDAKAESKMSPEQIAEKKKARFKEIDTNGDGKIDKAEFDAFGEKMKARRMGGDKPAAEAPKTDAAKTEAPKADAVKDAPKEEKKEAAPSH